MKMSKLLTIPADSHLMRMLLLLEDMGIDCACQLMGTTDEDFELTVSDGDGGSGAARLVFDINGRSKA